MIQIVALKKKATPEPKPETKAKQAKSKVKAKAESTESTNDVDKVKPEAKDKQAAPQNKHDKKADQNLFQAIGVVAGAIEVEDNNYFLNIDGYRFRCFGSRPVLSTGLEQGGNVYCKVWPGTSPDGEITFTIRYWRSEPLPNIEAGDFTLKGIWQNQDDVPGVRIYRNEASVQRRYNDRLLFRHLPLNWDDEKYPPYVHGTEGMKRYFIQVKASFDPEKKVFNVLKLLTEPTLKIPRYANSIGSLPYPWEKRDPERQEKNDQQEQDCDLTGTE